ncbi:MAG: phosphomannose isomerase type II C-terminal cupin domain [archaeon]
MKITTRPWGNFKLFAKNKKCTVKILEIKPRQELSLQYHKKREEMWYFLDKAIVQIGKTKKRVKPGEIVKVPKKRPHRIITGLKKVKVLEISFGEFREGDEVRLEDKYGRK